MLTLIFSATVTNLQQKLEGFQTANTLMKEDIRIAKSNIVQLQQENLNLRRDKESLLDQHHRQMQVRWSASQSQFVAEVTVLPSAVHCNRLSP